MTKSEMHRYDLAFTGPALLFLNQYFNSFINEYCLLWVALVRLTSAWKYGFSLLFWNKELSVVCRHTLIFTSHSFLHGLLRLDIETELKQRSWLWPQKFKPHLGQHDIRTATIYILSKLSWLYYDECTLSWLEKDLTDLLFNHLLLLWLNFKMDLLLSLGCYFFSNWSCLQFS